MRLRSQGGKSWSPNEGQTRGKLSTSKVPGERGGDAGAENVRGRSILMISKVNENALSFFGNFISLGGIPDDVGAWLAPAVAPSETERQRSTETAVDGDKNRPTEASKSGEESIRKCSLFSSNYGVIERSINSTKCLLCIESSEANEIHAKTTKSNNDNGVTMAFDTFRCLIRGTLAPETEKCFRAGENTHKGIHLLFRTARFPSIFVPRMRQRRLTAIDRGRRKRASGEPAFRARFGL